MAYKYIYYRKLVSNFIKGYEKFMSTNRAITL